MSKSREEELCQSTLLLLFDVPCYGHGAADDDVLLLAWPVR